jgi:hypothetical protein
MFSFLECLLGGQVSNKHGDCEGNSNKVPLNTSIVTLVSCKVLHVGEDHLHKIVASVHIKLRIIFVNECKTHLCVKMKEY